MHQTIEKIEVNNAYRWFLDLTLDDKLPHSTTYGKNYCLHFQDKQVISEIFNHIFNQTLTDDLIDSDEIFVDGTHIKPFANNQKYSKEFIDQQAKFMSD